MGESDTTWWAVIQAAAEGNPEAREEFARRYTSAVRAYLGARWRGTPCREDIDDAVQEVFLECFRTDGALDRIDRGQTGSFRAFLYGVVRNVARRAEDRRKRCRDRQPPTSFDFDTVAADEDTLSRVFDRAWATSILREAAALQTERAKAQGNAAMQRVDILRLRFHDNLPIREIARRWDRDAADLHREYARARQEFKAALLEVIAFHHPGSPAELQQRCIEVLSLLG